MTSTPPQFPQLEYGGSLLLAWQLRNKRVLIVGGGEVASGRLRNVLEADAFVTLISPLRGLNPEVHHRIFSDTEAQHRIKYFDRNFDGPADLDGVDLVLTAIDDVQVSREICTLSRDRKIPVNVADVPPECDFYFGSQIRNGPLQIMVSTGGKGPKIANIIRRRIEAAVPSNIGEAITKVGKLRERLRERAPGVGGAVGRKRMKWMIGVCEGWTLEELGGLDDDMMDNLLNDGWEKNAVVPSFQDVGGKNATWRELAWRLPSSLTLERAIPFVAGIAIGAVVATKFAQQ